MSDVCLYRGHVESDLTAGAGAGDAGGVAARRGGVYPGRVPLTVSVHPHLAVGADVGSVLTAVQVAEGDPGVQDVVQGDFCREMEGCTASPPFLSAHRRFSLFRAHRS